MKTAYHTPTSEIIRKYETTKNPVTRWAYREIIGNRIDRAESRHMNPVGQGQTNG